MRETRLDSENTGDNSTAPANLPRPGIVKIQEDASTELQPEWQTEALTSMKLLQKSGNILIESMDKLKDSQDKPDYTVMELVEVAKALAGTVQTQANLLKVFKGFK